MNYEELVSTNDNIQHRIVRIPIGLFKRKAIEGKYVNIVDLRKELTDNIIFCECLKKECDANIRLVNKRQLHFTPLAEKDILSSLEVEQGHFISFEHLLRDNPAVVSRPGFVNETVVALLEVTSYLNSQKVYHVCFSPSNVFVRKTDYSIVLLSHGSFYINRVSPELLYDGSRDYIAPEVLNGGSVDERCDVYSVGKFFEYLFSVAEMPYEYKKVIRKATSKMAEDRYGSIDEMKRIIRQRSNMWRTTKMLLTASCIALVFVGFFFGLMPEPVNVEYIKPLPKEPEEILLDSGFDPNTELGFIMPDTTGNMTPEQIEEMKVYEAKSEEIFRKIYTKEADRILSKIYNKTYMGANEKSFITGSQTTTDELLKAQIEIAAKAGISEAKSQKIAFTIIERITEEKKKGLTKYGIQK